MIEGKGVLRGSDPQLMPSMELGMNGAGAMGSCSICLFQERKELPETSSRGEIQETVCLFGLKSKLPQNPAKTSHCRTPCPHPGARR